MNENNWINISTKLNTFIAKEDQNTTLDINEPKNRTHPDQEWVLCQQTFTKNAE